MFSVVVVVFPVLPLYKRTTRAVSSRASPESRSCAACTRRRTPTSGSAVKSEFCFIFSSLHVHARALLQRILTRLEETAAALVESHDGTRISCATAVPRDNLPPRGPRVVSLRLKESSEASENESLKFDTAAAPLPPPGGRVHVVAPRAHRAKPTRACACMWQVTRGNPQPPPRALVSL